jgi:hypothetical protein
MYTHEGPRLYLTADRQTVVSEGDARAAFVLVGPGGQLSDEDAARYGLVAQAVAEKAAPVKPNKLGRGRANKAG